eukprot:7664611-Pyramimonas_sp.AAC.1
MAPYAPRTERVSIAQHPLQFRSLLEPTYIKTFSHWITRLAPELASRTPRRERRRREREDCLKPFATRFAAEAFKFDSPECFFTCGVAPGVGGGGGAERGVEPSGSGPGREGRRGGGGGGGR